MEGLSDCEEVEDDKGKSDCEEEGRVMVMWTD